MNRLFFCTIILALSGLLTGFDAAIISGALPLIAKQFALKHHLWQQSLIVSMVMIGAGAGAASAFIPNRKLGRRGSSMLSTILFLSGTVLAMSATTFAQLVIARFVLGFAIGIASVTTPLYLAEILPPRTRGSGIFSYQLCVTFGFLMAYLTNYFFLASGNWHAMFGVGIIPATLLLLGLFFIPETPRWLCCKSRTNKALAALITLGINNPKQQLEQIKATLNNPQSHTLKLNKKLYKLLLIVIAFFGFQSLTGINAIFYYAQTFFALAGFSAKSASLLAIAGLGVANFIAACFGTLLVDRLGRKRLLCVGYSTLIVSLFFLGALLKGWLAFLPESTAALFLFLFTFSFGVSLGGLPYVLAAELFPLRYRSQCIAIASSIGLWGSNIIILLTFLKLTHRLGPTDTLWLFAFISCIGFAFCYTFLPETKGQSLEQLEREQGFHP